MYYAQSYNLKLQLTVFIILYEFITIWCMDILCISVSTAGLSGIVLHSEISMLKILPAKNHG